MQEEAAHMAYLRIVFVCVSQRAGMHSTMT